MKKKKKTTKQKTAPKPKRRGPSRLIQLLENAVERIGALEDLLTEDSGGQQPSRPQVAHIPFAHHGAVFTNGTRVVVLARSESINAEPQWYLITKDNIFAHSEACVAKALDGFKCAGNVFQPKRDYGD